MMSRTPPETRPPTHPGGDRPKTQCLVLGSCNGLPELLEALRAHPGIEVVGYSENGAAATGEHAVDVVLQATSGGPEWLTQLTGIRERIDAPVVLLSSSSPEGMLETALEAGIEDVLILPEPVENVAFAIRRAGRSARGQGAAEEPQGFGPIITVFSPKGGTGKTAISTNLAAVLAKYLHRRTLLVDLDLQFGDAAILLGIEPERTLADLVAGPGELDAEKLAGYVSRHESGLDLLAAPLRPENAELVNGDRLGQVLDVARASYETVVVDTAPLFHEAVLTALEWTDALLIVCSPDVASLKNVRLSLRTLSLLSYPLERTRLILNHAHAAGGLKRSEVEDALGMKVGAEVPYDRGVPDALNRGIPAALAGGKGAFADAVRELAESTFPVSTAKPKRRGLLANLRTS
jgi:pilus assembly protein CpaE